MSTKPKPGSALAALLEDEAASQAATGEDLGPEELQRLQRIYLATGASALLCFASFHPLDLGPLVFLALVPLLTVAARERPWTAALMAYGATTLYHVVGLAWIAVVAPPGWLVTSFLEGFYGVALILGSLTLRRRTALPLFLILPVLGVTLEWMRGNTPFIAFPWLFFGQALHAQQHLIQVADLTSVYGLTFLALCVNGAVTDVLLLVRGRLHQHADLSPGDRFRLRLAVAAPLLLLAAAWLYGSVRVGQVTRAMIPGPRLAVVQVDLPQTLKDDAERPDRVAAINLEQTRRVMDRLVTSPEGDGVDAIIWSETMWPWPLPDMRTAESAERYRRWQAWVEERNPSYAANVKNGVRRLLDLPSRYQAPVLVGAMDSFWPELTGIEAPEHNSYYQLVPDTRDGAAVAARYDKVSLVPASEFIPWRDSALLGWLFRLIKSFVPRGFTIFEPGPGPVLMEAGGWRLSPSICFEISFPELLRLGTLAGADVLVCPANDGWFVRGGRDEPANPTAEIPLALDHAALRAIESRRGVVRCVNRGISCVIDPLGRVVEEVVTVVDGQPRRIGVAGELVRTVPTTRLTTAYVRFGNLFAWLCALGVAGLILTAWRSGREPAAPAA